MIGSPTSSASTSPSTCSPAPSTPPRASSPTRCTCSRSTPTSGHGSATSPELVPAAVTEVLRVEPVAPFTARVCLEDVDYQGVVFPAGSIVAICTERANRESRAGRASTSPPQRAGRSLTFGAGAHFCLGAHLARAELEEALGFLAPRMPGLALDGASDLRQHRGHLRGRGASPPLGGIDSARLGRARFLRGARSGTSGSTTLPLSTDLVAACRRGAQRVGLRRRVHRHPVDEQHRVLRRARLTRDPAP